MKQYNKENGRKNMRLHGYDYSRAGLYFLTIVVQNRLHLFDEIVRMGHNPFRGNVDLGIVDLDNVDRDNVDQGAHVGAPLRGRPDPELHPESGQRDRPESGEKYGIHNKKYGSTIGDVMDWFKTMITNEYIRGVKNYGWPPFEGKLWQRNYYDHIIRNEPGFVRISEYIINNPIKWENDKFYNG
jgi:putative transposase